MRTTLRIAFVAGCGIVCNVVVAWSLRALANGNSATGAERLESGWSRTEPIDCLATTSFQAGSASCSMYYTDRRVVVTLRKSSMRTPGGFHAALPKWAGLTSPPRAMDGTVMACQSADFELCGWPFLCMSEMTRHSIRERSSDPWGSRVTVLLSNEKRSFVLPASPLVLPFSINSALFSLPFAGMLLIRPIRASIRRRAGRCSCCGYQLHVDGPGSCPECGTLDVARSVERGSLPDTLRALP